MAAPEGTPADDRATRPEGSCDNGEKRLHGRFDSRGVDTVRNLKRSVPFVSILCLLLASCAAHAAVVPSGDAYRNTVTAAREALWKTIVSGAGNAATIAVMDGGRIVYSEGFGPADRATNRPVTADTRFNIGSTSKMFVAVATLLLADDGKLSVDDPVAKHLPEFVMKDPRYRDITVRMLFNHSSGLPGSTFEFGYALDAKPHATLLERLKDATLKHAPGAMGIYCNDGFTLAEMIVERLSGKKFTDFLAERVFGPLDMKNSGPSIGEWRGDVAAYYDAVGKKYPPEVVQVYGAGGLSSTAEDLCRFADSFAPGGKHILSDASVTEILKSQPTDFTPLLKGPAILDAFGWDDAQLTGYKKFGFQVLSKSGGTMFFSTNLALLPSKRMAVAVSISGHAAADAVTYAVMNALLKDRGLPFPEAPSVHKPAEPQPIPPELLAHAGFYANRDGGARIAFDTTKHTLNVHRLGAKDEPPVLTLVHNGGFFHDGAKGTRYYFVAKDGRTWLVIGDIPRFGADSQEYLKIEPATNPVTFAEDLNGTFWLRRDASPFVQVSDGLLTRSTTSAELPGYATFFGIVRIETPDFARIAATGSRDQTDIALVKKGSDVRLKAAGFTFSPVRSAGALAAGKTAVTIGADGENEWKRLDAGAILSFERPEKGRVVVLTWGEDDPKALFDSIVDSGDVYAPGGSFVFCAGKPGDAFGITAK
jgi:CubicO group peptidase (beta-lactamase class C family)